MPVLVRGALASAGAIAVLAASGCGGGTTTTTGRQTTTTETRVFVMSAGGQRLVAPNELSLEAGGAVAGEHLHWTGWGHPAAKATGVFTEHGFSSSNRVRFQSTLKLAELRVCRGAEYYTRAVVPLPSSGPFKASVNRVLTPCG